MPMDFDAILAKLKAKWPDVDAPQLGDEGQVAQAQQRGGLAVEVETGGGPEVAVEPLAEWNPAPVPAAAPLCLHRRFEAQVDRAPAALALSVEGESLTYGDLDAWANRIARFLQARGVRPGDRVALRLERSAEMVAAILGVLKAGAAYVPIDPAHPEERIAFTLQDSGAALLLTEVGLKAAGSQPPERLEVPVDPDLPAYVIYTSGSTGRPKGVVVTHADADRLFTATDPWFGFGSDDVWTLFHSYAFDFSVWEIWGALLYGGRLVVVPYWVSRSPEAFHELLREEGVTVLNQTPSAFRQLIWAAEGKPADLALRYVVFGGEALEPASLAPWFARYGDQQPRLINMYGITETTVHVTYRPVGEGDLAGGSRIGRPIPDLAVHLLDAALQPVPVGAPGEIHVGGAGLAQGYLNRPDLTAERFVPDPFAGTAGARLYRSGDLARRLPDGDLEYLGRIDNQVKIRGFRIELGEIEAALAAVPGVREVVVVVRSDRSDGSDRSDRSLVAYLVGEDLDTAALREALGRRLPDYMIPAAFVVLDALPLTPNGKVDRRALPSPDPAAGRTGEHRPPANPVEEVLAAACAELLGVERVGMGDSFFALGGHSLLATRLVSRVRRAFGVELPLRVIFETPTLGDLAAWIERHPAAIGAAFAPALADRGLVPASFAQERLWFLDRMDPGNPAFNMAMTLGLRGRLEAPTLERALNEVVRRHAALRTSFAEVDGRPVQRIAPHLEVPLRMIDLSPLPAAAREPEAARVTRSSVAAPFDLTAGPLVRAALARLAPDHHLFLLDVHHIVSDGWSSTVMVRELIALYAAFVAGLPSPLPPLPLQYADFARRQREELNGPVLEAQLAYWRDKLGGTLEPLALPTDHPRPAVQTFRGGSLGLEAPEALAEALRRLAREERASLFMVLLAALDLLLARLSGQDDVVVGSPIAGRQHAETEELIGLFLNTLALRTGLSGDPTFRELLARVRETTLGAYAHQDVPFEALLADLKPARDLSRTPVFQVLLNMLSFPTAQGRLPDGLEIEPGPAPEPESKFDLTLYVVEAAGAIRFDLVYNADLFDAPRMRELLRQYRAVLAAVAGDPGRRLWPCCPSPPAPCRRRSRPWRSTSASSPAPGSTPAARPPSTPTASGPGGTSTRRAAGWPPRYWNDWRKPAPPPRRSPSGPTGPRRWPRPCWECCGRARRSSSSIPPIRRPAWRRWRPGRGRGPGWRCRGRRRSRRRWRRRSPASPVSPWTAPGCPWTPPPPAPRSTPTRRRGSPSPPAPPASPRGSWAPTARCRTSWAGTSGPSAWGRGTASACSPAWRTIRCCATSSPPSGRGASCACPLRSGWASRGGSPAGWRRRGSRWPT